MSEQDRYELTSMKLGYDDLKAENDKLKRVVLAGDRLGWSLFGSKLDSHPMRCLEDYRSARETVRVRVP